ncbi:uncharacterized protein LOC124354809 [Homalodisca vitripennis]|uniref:uncharacterized protein LOC124354809 n=1 Tax=Homalodisca vitripennis TaxID=197043 RepID=UPI001EEA1D30|nr:uncharacterized protein LOC124354809 [Homalodisca vitripennis]
MSPPLNTGENLYPAQARSYHTDRRLIVRLNAVASTSFDADSVIPQGFHIRPVLFSIFMNYIKHVIKAPFLLFADDIKLLIEVASLLDYQSLQGALDDVFDWCLTNGMAVNPSKTKLMKFNRKLNSVVADYFLDGNRV